MVIDASTSPETSPAYSKASFSHLGSGGVAPPESIDLLSGT